MSKNIDDIQILHSVAATDELIFHLEYPLYRICKTRLLPAKIAVFLA